MKYLRHTAYLAGGSLLVGSLFTPAVGAAAAAVVAPFSPAAESAGYRVAEYLDRA